jgi:hypothetical protein
MYFYDEEHEENFELMKELYPECNRDRGYKAACYILAHPCIHDSVPKNRDEWLFGSWVNKKYFTETFLMLIKLGKQLFTGNGSFPLMDGIAFWDEKNYLVFKQACDIRKGLII